MKTWFIPLIAFILFIPFSGPLDLYVTNYFYEQGVGFQGNWICQWLYMWGFLPALMVTGMSFFLCILSFFSKKYSHYKKPCLLLVLTMLLGTMFICHAVLKDHWGRPRPKQTEMYGGVEPFKPMWKPNANPINPPCRSFCSGHASVGFYFFAFYFIGRARRRKALMRSGLIIGLVFGCLLSYARIAHGAHYLSDTVTSAFVMWFTSYSLYLWLLKPKEKFVVERGI